MKNFNYKALLLNHGEKIGAGVVGLLAMLVLAGTSWGTFSHEKGSTPEALKAEAEKSRKAMLSSVWPEEKRQLFEQTPPVQELVAQMANAQTDIDQFSFSKPFYEPINPVREKRSAIAAVAPEFPEAHHIDLILALAPEDELEDEESDEEMDMDKAQDPDDPSGKSQEDLRKMFGIAGRSAGGAGGLGGGEELGAFGAGPGSMGMGMKGAGGMMSSGRGPGGAFGGESEFGGSSQEDADYNAQFGGAMGGKGGMGGMMSSGMMGGGMMGSGMMGMEMGLGDMTGTALAGPVDRVRRDSAAVVNYVFDLRKQRREIAEALHVAERDPEVGASIDFINLVIERQTRLAGPDPWVGEWNLIQLQDLNEAIEDIAGFTIDVVEPGVTNSVITMPLPQRYVGTWDPEVVSHSNLENYELSPEEQEQQAKLQELIAQKAKESEELLKQQGAVKGGFSNMQRDMGALQQQLGSMGMMDDIYSSYGDSMMDSYGDEEGNEMSSSDYSRMGREKFDAADATARGKLMLIRFLDFTVEEGHTYRYRVRVELANPNFNKPLDALEQPDLARQPTLLSDWSEPTPPVEIPYGYRYYVDSIVDQYGRDDQAKVSMFTYHPETGMQVLNDENKAITVGIGQRIGGPGVADVVDVTKQTVLKNESVDFTSSDTLLGLERLTPLNRSDFPELQNWISQKPREQLGGVMLVLDAEGEMQMRFIGDNDRQQAEDRSLVKLMLEYYEKLGWGADAGGAAFPGFGGGDDTMDMGGYGSMMSSFGASSSLNNPLSNKSSRSSRAARRASRAQNQFGYGSEGGGDSGEEF